MSHIPPLLLYYAMFPPPPPLPPPLRPIPLHPFPFHFHFPHSTFILLVIGCYCAPHTYRRFFLPPSRRNTNVVSPTLHFSLSLSLSLLSHFWRIAPNSSEPMASLAPSEHNTPLCFLTLLSLLQRSSFPLPFTSSPLRSDGSSLMHRARHKTFADHPPPPPRPLLLRCPRKCK